MADDGEQLAECIVHEFVGVREIAHQHHTLDGRKTLQEVEVLLVVRGIAAFEVQGELLEEEREDAL